ncbi:MAG: hypothetical protein NC344_09785 [Bacteroidales bacterium]|nr:hypothetical protein [Bacteroidales bacterium]MCM1148094.1 hypothetical protein [Bacteroidales bacterium]MCM1509450.1 hypothetical protein [Clostridium sp.]
MRRLKGYEVYDTRTRETVKAFSRREYVEACEYVAVNTEKYEQEHDGHELNVRNVYEQI